MKLARLLAFLALVLSAETSASMDAEAQIYGRYTTANGRTLNLPDPSQLDCHGMNMVLSQIDRTGYRVGPSPRSNQDMALFNYESLLTERRYVQCTGGGGRSRAGVYR